MFLVLVVFFLSLLSRYFHAGLYTCTVCNKITQLSVLKIIIRFYLFYDFFKVFFQLFNIKYFRCFRQICLLFVVPCTFRNFVRSLDLQITQEKQFSNFISRLTGRVCLLLAWLDLQYKVTWCYRFVFYRTNRISWNSLQRNRRPNDI